MYNECPLAGSADCQDDSTAEAVGCEVVSVAGRVGSCYTVRLSGPDSTSGTVEHTGDGIFKAEYLGPAAGEYELEVRAGTKYNMLNMTLETIQFISNHSVTRLEQTPAELAT